jgi:flagellar biogenesis protein FliO
LIAGLTQTGGMPLPSAMRVVAGVLITLGLALGGIVALKKLLLKTDGRFSSQGMRILGRAVLGSSLRAHLLQVEASRVLVVEGRSGIAITVLPCAVQDDERKAK